jgi:hypothetical protein
LTLPNFIRFVSALSPLLECPMREWWQGEMILLKKIDGVGNE